MVKVEFSSTDHVENPRNPISLPDQSHENWWTQSSYKSLSAGANKLKEKAC